MNLVKLLAVLLILGLVSAAPAAATLVDRTE